MIENIIFWSTHNRFFLWIGKVLIIEGVCGNFQQNYKTADNEQKQ